MPHPQHRARITPTIIETDIDDFLDPYRPGLQLYAVPTITGREAQWAPR